MTDISKLMEIWDGIGNWEDKRKEIINLLLNKEYGFLPPAPNRVMWKIVSEEKKFCAGKALLLKVMLTVELENGEYSFPVYAMIPYSDKQLPFFVHINFRSCVPDRYLPSEEICDRGYAVISFGYEDVTKDNDDFSDGLAGVYFKDRLRKDDDCGKIGLWAWAAMRAMDYAQSINELDKSRAFVVGHSRLGKAALLTGALDERFACTFSNNSGCCGAAISRAKQGETIKNITDVFPFWFCPGFLKYADNEDKLPFDQHFLLAAMAPRRVYVASAVGDLWADPESEFLSCQAASEVYKKLCKTGLCGSGRIYHGGSVAYHKRDGLHYLSREDWENYMDYLDKIRSKK